MFSLVELWSVIPHLKKDSHFFFFLLPIEIDINLDAFSMRSVKLMCLGPIQQLLLCITSFCIWWLSLFWFHQETTCKRDINVIDCNRLADSIDCADSVEITIVLIHSNAAKRFVYWHTFRYCAQHFFALRWIDMFIRMLLTWAVCTVRCTF